MWDVLKTHEKGRPLAYKECVAVNRPLDDALMIAERARIGWDADDFRIVASPLPCGQKEGPAL